MTHDSYVSPLSGRYPSSEMKRIWSDTMKFETWRRMWIRLAEAQQRLGLNITDEQIAEMRQQVSNIDYENATQYERKLRHDVVAHIHAYGDVAPLAKGIIHLGATSCYVTDNTDLIQIKAGFKLLCLRVARACSRLRDFAWRYRNLPTLGLTHLQPAQPTTVGKRAAMWLQDLIMDLEALEDQCNSLKFLGVKGTTGTQDSFMELFDGDHAKVKELDRLVTEASGFTGCFAISGQTYTRKLDSRVLRVLADFAASAHKICFDLRVLQSRKEIEEPFEKEQIGSSAMAYKRNPMRAERNCSLGRNLMVDSLKPLLTHATQLFERTLDDSAGRRQFLSEAFLLADSIALILQNVFEGLVVYPKMIERNLMAELPFMATERILMVMVKEGVDRQICHEKIRNHAQEAGRRIKEEGVDNDLLDRIRQDEYFSPIHGLLNELVSPANFVGRAPEQVEEYMEVCDAALLSYQDQLIEKSDLSV